MLTDPHQLSPDTSPFARFQSVRYFRSLDGLRCLAIIGVVWQHSTPLPPSMVPLTNVGASGVALFFVLSGFLITTLLLREEAATGTLGLKSFYIRRGLRIFPLYYAVLCLYAVLALLLERNSNGELNGAARLFFANIPYYATYTNNWFVDLMVNDDGARRVIFIFAWTLATEEQFYAFWPPILKYLPRWGAVSTLLAVLATDLVLSFGFPAMDLPSSAIERLIRIGQSPSTEICLGVLLAMALNSRKVFEFAWRFLGSRASSPVFGILAVMVCLWPWGNTPLWYLLQSLAFGLFLVSCVIREDHGISRLLTLRILSRIGVVSYGMYLLHMLAINLTSRVAGQLGITSRPLMFLGALILAYLAAELSFRLFEQPFLRLKSKFIAKPATVSATGGATP